MVATYEIRLESSAARNRRQTLACQTKIVIIENMSRLHNTKGDNT